MSRPNRIFPAWKKGKKGDRMPGSHPPKKNRILKPIVTALILLGLLAGPVQAGGPVVGIASHYGPGSGAAMPFCTWTYRTAHGCGAMVVTSLDTGLSAVVPIIDYCQCYVGTQNERVIDLQWGVVAALGLNTAQGLYRVTLEPFSGSLPDTAMETRRIAPHWLE
jgi:hypothetical protein